jgi:hypothetical protein
MKTEKEITLKQIVNFWVNTNKELFITTYMSVYRNKKELKISFEWDDLIFETADKLNETTSDLDNGL